MYTCILLKTKNIQAYSIEKRKSENWHYVKLIIIVDFSLQLLSSVIGKRGEKRRTKHHRMDTTLQSNYRSRTHTQKTPPGRVVLSFVCAWLRWNAVSAMTRRDLSNSSVHVMFSIFSLLALTGKRLEEVSSNNEKDI